MSNIPDVKVEKYPITNPVTGAITYVNRKVLNAITAARILQDEFEKAELSKMRFEAYNLGWKVRYKRYLFSPAL